MFSGSVAPCRARRILILGVYSIAKPRYGGPKRSRAIRDALASRGHAVRYVGVLPRYGADPAAGDILVSRQTQQDLEARPHLADWICGEAIHRDDEVRRRVEKVIDRFRPDTVIVESPYPYFGLAPVLSARHYDGELVYSSHNVEHLMKPAIYTASGCSAAEVEELSRTLREAEETLLASSDLVLGVTREDCEVLGKLGARRVVLTPNGIDAPRYSRIDAHRYRRQLKRAGVDRTAVFVSSAHVPNVHGFRGLLGTRLGFVPSRAAIVLAGSVASLINTRSVDHLVERVTFDRRTIALGSVSDVRLTSALSSAEAILLPITHGGGSNLKTAEALVARRPIVATSFAFRGYEEYLSTPGVVIADDEHGFREAVREALLPRGHRDVGEGSVDRSGLFWRNRLAPMLDALGS